METITRRFAVVIAIGAAALLSLGVTGTAMASAQPEGVYAVPQVSATSVTGTWHNYKDSTGDTGETLKLSGSGRASFSPSGCAGVWSQVGNSVGIALNSTTCNGAVWDFTGTLKNGGHALGGKGRFANGSVIESFTWSATR